MVPVRADPSGIDGPTPQQVRGKRWRRVAPGWFVPATTNSAWLPQRIVEAATGIPAGAAVTGWAALAWQGARWFDGVAGDGATPLPVPVALDDQRTIARRAGVRLSEDWLFEEDLTTDAGLPITVPNRSVTFEARRARGLAAAVTAIDLACASDLVDLEGLSAYIARLPSRPGIRLLRVAVEQADENVWSPQEPPMRMAWCHDAGRPRPLCNRPIFDAQGRHLVTPDLFDPHAGVAGEYDGLLHLADGQRRRDLEREELYRAHGIELVTMMTGDRWDTSRFVARLDAAYARAARRTRQDTWTLAMPEGWVDTSTVAARRALSDRDRQVWLRWQAS